MNRRLIDKRILVKAEQQSLIKGPENNFSKLCIIKNEPILEGGD
jgi:hypothetical protein